MDQIRISDITMKQTGKEFTLSFKEKLEIPKLLDKLSVSVIELEGIKQPKIDALRIKSVASTVKNSIVAVPVALSPESVEITWNALKEAKHPRLQVFASVSPVQMEYLFHKKPDAMLQAIKETISACCEKTSDVEFIADDATRSDSAFLYKVMEEVIAAGAKTVTVCDATGAILPDELGVFLDNLYANVPSLKFVGPSITSFSNAVQPSNAPESQPDTFCTLAGITNSLIVVLPAKPETDLTGNPLNSDGITSFSPVLTLPCKSTADIFTQSCLY